MENCESWGRKQNLKENGEPTQRNRSVRVNGEYEEETELWEKNGELCGKTGKSQENTEDFRIEDYRWDMEPWKWMETEGAVWNCGKNRDLWELGIVRKNEELLENR